MELYAFDKFCSDEAIKSDGVIPVASEKALYETCDVVSLHIPATAETKKSINKELLALMPKGAVLVNTARKEVINEEEMVQLMAERADFKYLTDITPGNHDEMMEIFADRYFSTPKKMGAQTSEANINAGIAAAKQIVDFFKNGNQRFRVN
jgi:D-3-phosphoglycerate dehydrogenase